MTKIKICGITNIEDALAAVEAGADLLGFILYPKSPRFVAVEMIREIVDAVCDRVGESARPRFVGVFVNVGAVDVAATLTAAGLDLAQLHGDEPEADLVALPGRAFKALRPATVQEALAGAARFGPLGIAVGPSLMIDAYDPAAYGGTGQKADWHAAAAVAAHLSGLLLAGGLTPANVAQAVQVVRPWGVDVSSGVERAPGRKDHAQIAAFAAAVRAASRS